MRRRRAKFKSDDEVAALAAANTATVEGTLIDSDGQEWALATWYATPVSPTSKPLFLDGTPVPTFSGQLSESGVFSGVIGLTSMMQPAGTTFRIEVHSATSAPASVVSRVRIVSTPFDLGAMLSPLVQAPRITAAPLVYAYNETEIVGASNGSGFINTTNAEAFVFVGGVWVPLAAGSPTPDYPGPGIAVSTGTGWGASITPATLATYPPAGLPQSTGTAWGASLAATSFAQAIKSLPTGTDLNTVTTTGTYILSQWTNGPAGNDLNAAFMQVMSLAPTPGFLVQVFYPGSNSVPPDYFFARYQTSATWGAWVKFTGV